MVEFSTSPLAKEAAKIYDRVSGAIGVCPASHWMFSGCFDLDGQSPVEAIRAGRVDEVREAADRIIALRKGKPKEKVKAKPMAAPKDKNELPAPWPFV
jgi:hypothetical protein